MCFGEYILYKSGEKYNLSSCEIIELFYNIRIDYDKLRYAVNITKITNDVSTENQNNYKILQLFLNTLYVISETEKSLNLILSIFKIRLLSIIGLKPIIERCTECKTKENLIYFSIKNDGFKCGKCGKNDSGAIQIKIETKDAIRYIILTDAKKIFSFTIPEESKKELELISKIYLEEKLEKEYKII